MHRLVSLGVVLPALMLTASGCVATRDWVNELLGKKEAQIDQRFVAVDGRLKGLDGQVGEAGETARQAQTRADAAFTRGDEVDQRLTRLWTGRHKRNLVETINVQFAFDRWDLSDSAQTALIGVVKELKANPALTVDLEGYTDPVGTREYNVGLSQRRVEAVRRYLILNGTELPRITSIGLGVMNGEGSKESHSNQRRVTVRLMTPVD